MARSGKIMSKKKQKNVIAPGFKKQVKKFMDEHKDVLRELAKK